MPTRLLYTKQALMRSERTTANDVGQWPSRRCAIIGIVSSLSLTGAPIFAQAQGRAGIIDTHLHIERDSRRRDNVQASIVVRLTDTFGIEKAILTPPPFQPRSAPRYGLNALRMVARQQKQRLAFMAGGDTLNPVIQATPPDHASGDSPAPLRRAGRSDCRVRCGGVQRVGNGAFLV